MASRAIGQDTIIVWKELAKASHLNVPELEGSSFEETLAKAKGFSQWITDNEAVLRKLDCLNLCDRGITTLPPEIGQLSSLWRLYLDNNKLTTLPPEIIGLTSLNVLSLAGNGFVSLPMEIGKLPSLQFFNLECDQRYAFKAELGRLYSVSPV